MQRSPCSSGYQKIDIIRHAKSSDKCMIDIFVEAEIFVIRGKAVDAWFQQKDDIIDEGASTSQVIRTSVGFGLQNLYVSLAICQQTYKCTTLQLEYTLCLELQLVKFGTGN